MKASELKITDIRVADINGLPKHMILLKVYTNDPDIIGYGEVRDASSATYAKMLKSRLVGENPLNAEKLFNRIKQFGGHSRQGGGVSGIEILNAPGFVNFASAFDKSNILIKVYFTNDTYTTIPLSSAGVAITGDIDSTNVNGNYYAPCTQLFSVSYEGVSASVPVPRFVNPPSAAPSSPGSFSRFCAIV